MNTMQKCALHGSISSITYSVKIMLKHNPHTQNTKETNKLCPLSTGIHYTLLRCLQVSIIFNIRHLYCLYTSELNFVELIQYCDIHVSTLIIVCTTTQTLGHDNNQTIDRYQNPSAVIMNNTKKSGFLVS